MTVIRSFGVSGVASSIEFGKRGGTLAYDDATKVFSFALSSALTIPSGDDSTRPVLAQVGMIRVNTQNTPALELYNGSSWVSVGSGGGSGTGSVSSVSVVTANGFTGTVSNATTTPAITLGTTLQGLLKGSSGTLVVASTSTDYQVPLALTTAGVYGPSTFDGKTLNIPILNDYVRQLVAGTNVQLNPTTGTGVVEISVPIINTTNISGGLANQIPFQSAPSTTVFSNKFTWADYANTLTLGDVGSTAFVSGINGSNTTSGGSLHIRGGSGGTGSNPGSVTITGGTSNNYGSTGGSVIIQSGIGASIGGEILFRTANNTSLIDRFRILRNGAWSVGIDNSFTGAPGQVLTSNGPISAPTWENPSSSAGVTQILAGAGIALSPSAGTGIVTINATGAGGTTPGGSAGQLQFNDSNTFAGTSQMQYNGTDTLTVGAVNSTFKISGLDAGSGQRPTTVSIKPGTQITSGGQSAALLLQGGNSNAASTTAGSVIISGGLGLGATSSGGAVTIQTGASGTLVSRLTITDAGAWGLDGANYGSAGQVLTSQGPGLPPLWQAGGGGGGGSGVTLVNVSGGTTGLTTVGGPITNTGTITLTGTLAVSAGGTGLSALPGASGSLFFNNNNTLSEITGLLYDGGSNLLFDNLNITSSDNFNAFTAVNSISVKPGTARNNNAFAGSAIISGGDSYSTLNAAGNAVLSGGINTSPAKSGSVVLKTNNLDRLTVAANGAWALGASYGTAGQVLTSNGANVAPTWQSVGTGGGGISAVTASSPLSSSGGNTPNISLATVPATLGGTGQTNYATGDILYADTASTLRKLNLGINGQVLTVQNNRPQWSSTAGGVTSFSGGTTGLTPAIATSGAVTLAGKLNVGSGGTNATTKYDAFNNLAPTQFSGDLIYRDALGNIRLPIGSEGQVLTSISGTPTWAVVNSLPSQSSRAGYFLTTNGTTASWSAQIYTSTGTSNAVSVNVIGETGGSPIETGGNVNLVSGGNGLGGSINLTLGYGSSNAVSIKRKNITGTESGVITFDRSGAIGLSGNDYGAAGQILTSAGSGAAPTWQNPASGLPTQTGNSGKYLTTNGTDPSWADLPENVSRIIAGNSNVVISPTSGTGTVTISVVGSGFQGVTSFSAGDTGLYPNTTSTGPITLTGTLLTTSGGTGIGGSNPYSVGDILYANSSTTLTKLPLGSNGQVLSVGGLYPVWVNLSGVPSQTGAAGRFLTTNGGTASWSTQVLQYLQPTFGGSSKGNNIKISATDGTTNSIGGDVILQAGSTNGVFNSGGGNIQLILGVDPVSGYFVLQNPSTEFFRVSKYGSWSLGSTGSNFGNSGSVLVSQGEFDAPTWQNIDVTGLPNQFGAAGKFLTTDGITASWQVITGGSGNPGGSTGQLQWNNDGAFAGTLQMNYNSSNQLTVGTGGGNFTFLGAASTNGTTIRGGNITIKGGLSGAASNLASGGNVILQGGDGRIAPSTGDGGNVSIVGGSSLYGLGGYVAISTGATTTERLRIQDNGAWSIQGLTGNSGQVLVSSGSSSSPTWQNITSGVSQITAGTNITLSSTGPSGTGNVTVNAPYTTATTSVLGTVKIGSGLAIASDGTLSLASSGTILNIVGGDGILANNVAGTVTVSATTATTTTLGSIKVGSGLSISADGTLSVVPTPEKFDLGFAVTGLASSGNIALYVASRSFTIPANLVGTYTRALSPATANTTIQIFKSSAAGVISNVGAILFAASASTGALTFPSSVVFGAGDVLYMVIANPDTTLGDIAITIAGTLN